MHRKQHKGWQSETASLIPFGGAAKGALERPDKPVESAVEQGGGALVGEAVGKAVTPLAAGAANAIVPGSGALVGMLAPVAGGFAGSKLAKGTLSGKKPVPAAADMDETGEPDILEKFMNKHSSTVEAVQEFDQKSTPAPAPEGHKKDEKFVIGTQCRTG